MTSTLRVLMVSDVSALHIHGGAERVLWEQASRLAKRGHQVRIVSRFPEKDVPETSERGGVRIRHYPADRRSPLRFLLCSLVEARRAVTAALDEEGADVLHLYQPFSAYGCLHSDRVRSMPVLYSFLSPAPLEYVSRTGMSAHHQPGLIGRAAQIMLWGIERACLRRATRIHVLSDFSAELLWKLYGIGADRIVKIPGGADVERFHPAVDRDAVRKALGLPTGSPLLLTVRNLEARMGLDVLIRAMALLRRRIPGVTLLICGEGNLRGDLESLSASLDLQRHIRFLGHIPEADLSRYYQAADAFVLPTRALEGFGLITVESLASGTPVLGTHVGATPEILLPLDPLLLFREVTPEAMADGLARFVETNQRDPVASQSLRQACRRHAELYYCWDRSVARLEETLDALTQDRSQSPATTPCPACGGVIRKPDVVYLGTPYLRCAQCRTGVVRTPPSMASLRRAYEFDYPFRFSHESVPKARAELFDSILDRLGALGSKGRLLDVGCSGGHLLVSARRRGRRGLGADLSYQACAVARRTGVPVVQTEGAALPLRNGGVDTTLLINVLDHTPDPLATLRECYRVLPPGGHLVVRIPNAIFHRPWARLLTSLGLLIRWHGWDGCPVFHLFAFTPGGLRSLVTRAGFHVLEVRNSTLVAEGLFSAQNGPRATGPRWLHGCVAAAAFVVNFLSRGRWLLGPSIELYAQKPSTARLEGTR
jgi:glycosyltransferase involved in cell wall biosynthesis/SAM-dependent methyltransferase